MNTAPAFLRGLFPRIEERQVDPRDSLLIALLDREGKPDPTFNVIAVRPAMGMTQTRFGEQAEAKIELYLAPNVPGASYEFTLYPRGLSPLRLGAFRFVPGQVCDLLAALVTAEHRSAIRVSADWVGLGESPVRKSADLQQARRIAAKLFGPEPIDTTEPEPEPSPAHELTAA